MNLPTDEVLRRWADFPIGTDERKVADYVARLHDAIDAAVSYLVNENDDGALYKLREVQS